MLSAEPRGQPRLGVETSRECPRCHADSGSSPQKAQVTDLVSRKTLCCVLVTTRIFGIFRLRRRMRSDCAQGIDKEYPRGTLHSLGDIKDRSLGHPTAKGGPRALEPSLSFRFGESITPFHVERRAARTAAARSRNIPRMPALPCRFREFSPESSGHGPCLEKTPCCVLVTTRIFGIFRLRRRMRSHCAQDDKGIAVRSSSPAKDGCPPLLSLFRSLNYPRGAPTLLRGRNKAESWATRPSRYLAPQSCHPTRLNINPVLSKHYFMRHIFFAMV